jgi:hypothetical protein
LRALWIIGALPDQFMTWSGGQTPLTKATLHLPSSVTAGAGATAGAVVVVAGAVVVAEAATGATVGVPVAIDGGGSTARVGIAPAGITGSSFFFGAIVGGI